MWLFTRGPSAPAAQPDAAPMRCLPTSPSTSYTPHTPQPPTPLTHVSHLVSVNSRRLYTMTAKSRQKKPDTSSVGSCSRLVEEKE